MAKYGLTDWVSKLPPEFVKAAIDAVAKRPPKTRNNGIR